ncbi:MAG TPA: mechanosensitive ion channel domain-containing protein [Acetobacteraceae bacterium]|nr:mechanosensitive ion channel domain-containing protein [Acetobacteraceae bacterium]
MRRFRLRLPAAFALAAILLGPVIAHAASSASAPPASVPAAAPQLSPAQAQQVISLLQDPKQRAAFLALLQAVAHAPPVAAAAQPAATPPAAKPAGTPVAATPAAPAAKAAALPLPLAPDSLGAQLLVDASHRAAVLTRQVGATFRAVSDFPLLWHWLTFVATDAWLQGLLLSAAWRLLVVLLVAGGGEWLTARALRRPRAGLVAWAEERRARRTAAPDDGVVDVAEERAEAGETEPPSRHRFDILSVLRRLPFALGYLALGLVPVLVFAAIGNVLSADGLGAQRIARLVIVGVVNAYVLSRVLMCVVRALVCPESAAMRLVHMRDGSAVYIVRWVRRIIAVSVFGYVAAEVGLLFGLYPAAHEALIKLVALVVHVMLIVMVIQTRQSVARHIQARPGSTGFLAGVRNRLARVWPYVAVFYLVALWVVWALGISHGFARLLRFVVVTVATFALARLLTVTAHRAIERAVQLRPEVSQRYPGLQARTRHYHPLARGLASTIILFVALVLLLQGWGFDSLSWFTYGQLGGRVISALVTIMITIIIALLVWEVANAATQRHIGRLSREGKAGRAARLRTLLPMLRTALVVMIGVVVGLIVLSTIGVNIAPLLAGAGVIGLAIGFGSQKLVQDLITGLFLLLEDAIQVGDVVSLGGLSGTVENLSVRTIRLRSSDGSVHVIPFSAVTTVTNQTRDYGYAVANIGVAYKEDVDHVIEVLKGIVKEMRADPAWERMVQDDLEVWGLDQFGASSVTISCRIRTGPFGRWSVGREFNRRLKARFDELGIEMPFPHQKIVLDPDLAKQMFGQGRPGTDEPDALPAPARKLG